MAGAGDSASTSTASVAATADVAIIGAGIVGSGVALELARRGLSSVCIDKGSGPGQGSTSFSSGICRTYYSVLHSVQFSYEGYRVWQDWEEYVGVKDDRGMARLRECGGMILKSPDAQAFLAKTLPLHDQVRVVCSCCTRTAAVLSTCVCSHAGTRRRAFCVFA